MTDRVLTQGHSGATVSIQNRVAAAVVAGLLGVFMIYGVGFAQPSALHNAAHDGRHAFTFPCH